MSSWVSLNDAQSMSDVCLGSVEAYGSEGRKRSQYIPSSGKSSRVNNLVKRLAGGTDGQKEVKWLGFQRQRDTNLKLSTAYHWQVGWSRGWQCYCSNIWPRLLRYTDCWIPCSASTPSSAGTSFKRSWFLTGVVDKNADSQRLDRINFF